MNEPAANPTMRARYRAKSPFARPSSPPTRPNSPPFREAANDGPETIGLGPANLSTQAFRYVQPSLTPATNATTAGPSGPAMPRPRLTRHINWPVPTPSAAQLERWRTTLQSFGGQLQAVGSEVQRLSAQLPLEWVPLASAVPGALSTCRRAQAGVSTLRFLQRIEATLGEAERRDAQRTHPAPSWHRAHRRRQNAEALAARLAVRDAYLFVAFETIELTGAMLAAASLGANLLSRGALAHALSGALVVITPLSLALHGLLQLGRHTLLWWQASEARRALAYSRTPTGAAAAHRAHRLSYELERERHYRAVQAVGWALFNVGLVFASGLVTTAALTPVTAALLLGLGIAGSKGLETIWLGRFDIPETVIWPRGAADNPKPLWSAHRERCFAEADLSGQALLAFAAYRGELATMEAALFDPLPVRERRLLGWLLHWQHLPLAPLAFGYLCKKALADRPDAVALTVQVCVSLANKQYALQERELGAHPFDASEGLPPEPIASLEPAALASAYALTNGWASLAREAAFFAEMLAQDETPAAGVWTTPGTKAWPWSTPKLNDTDGLTTADVPALLWAAHMGIRVGERSLLWGASVGLLAGDR